MMRSRKAGWMGRCVYLICFKVWHIPFLIENYFSSLDTLHEAAVTDYTQNKIILSGSVC